jgi:alpha-galactosidase
MSIKTFVTKSLPSSDLKEAKIFKIDTLNTTYAIEILNGYVNNAYWGEKLINDFDIQAGLEFDTNQFRYADYYRQREEYPFFGGRFYDNECLKVNFPDGVRDTVLKYTDYEITDDETKLTLILKDEVYPLTVKLIYKIYDGLDLIDRHTEIINDGEGEIQLETFYSANWILGYDKKQRLTYMGSGWGHEYEVKTADVGLDTVVLQSKAGVSCAQNIPYFAVDDYTATEHTGNVYFGTLQWSGNWQMNIGRTINRITQVNAGISNFDCDIWLKGGESFVTPVFTGGFVTEGFGSANRQLHDYLRKTTKNQFTNKVMPVLYNAWATFLFDVSEELIMAQAKKCADLGVELLLIDDGWMKGRKNSNAGLGDWVPDPEKFPNGLKPVVDYVNSLGMKFGLWVEPEMVNPDSDLYRAHPDWVMNYPTREREEKRNQLTLNFAREDVYEHTIKWLDELLSSANIECLKWDMNRYFSQAGWPELESKEQKSLYVKYVQNLHRVFAHINEKFPHVMIENCASGGLRSDFGMAPYSGRINRSDNQDAIDALQLHEGFTKFNLAKTAGGGCHFHHVPYFPNGRAESMKFLAHVAYNASLSVGYDLRKLDDEQIEALKGYIAYYKKIRETVQLGDMYVLSSAFDKTAPYVAFQYVAKDKKKSVILVYGNNNGFILRLPAIMPRGLDPKKLYKVTLPTCNDWKWDYPVLSGDGLMEMGVNTARTSALKDPVYDAFAIEIEEVE